jgi:hypothetical protein
MNDKWLHRLAWGLALYTVTASIVTAVWLFWAADYTRLSWLEPQVRTIVNLGAPILGLVIVRQQPRQRVGWLFLILGVLVSFRGLGYAIYFGNGAQAVGYSPLRTVFVVVHGANECCCSGRTGPAAALVSGWSAAVPPLAIPVCDVSRRFCFAICRVVWGRPELEW